MSKIKWSPYQKEIFKFCAKGKGNGIVQAAAGAAKTTTIVKALEYCQGTTVFLAFNKSIATELSKRGVNGQTFHGLCYTSVRKGLGVKRVDSNKVYSIMKKTLNPIQLKRYASVIQKLVGLAKNSGVGIIYDHNEIYSIMNDHDISNDQFSGGTISELVDLYKKIFDMSVNDHSCIDFDDMIYFAAKYELPLPKYDFIFCDELQDTNIIQILILKQMMTPKTRFIGVGDRHQSIYMFRGAVSNAMEQIKKEFDCQEFPLSVSYRCAKEIVRYAQKYNHDIEAFESSPEGKVYEMGSNWSINDLQSTDMVVCRTTKPLVSTAYKCIQRGIPAMILGRDIGKGLKSIITRLAKSNPSILNLITEMEVYKAREVEKYTRLNQLNKAESVIDKIDTILCVISGLSNDNYTVSKLLESIDLLFAEKKNAILFSTIHKAKGLESERIYWMNYHQCPAPWAKTLEAKKQELNCCYVAVTRAKKELYLIRE